MIDNPKEFLEEIRELFRRSHWIKGESKRWDFKKGATCYCLGGALSYLPGYSQAARNVAVDAVKDSVPPGYVGIVHFNDSPSTTKDDVIKLLDKAIETL